MKLRDLFYRQVGFMIYVVNIDQELGRAKLIKDFKTHVRLVSSILQHETCRAHIESLGFFNFDVDETRKTLTVPLS